jgi:hypothetical protein
VTRRLKAVILNQKEADIARQRRDKYFSAGTNKEATMEELVEAVFFLFGPLQDCSEDRAHIR